MEFGGAGSGTTIKIAREVVRMIRRKKQKLTATHEGREVDVRENREAENSVPKVPSPPQDPFSAMLNVLQGISTVQQQMLETMKGLTDRVHTLEEQQQRYKPPDARDVISAGTIGTENHGRSVMRHLLDDDSDDLDPRYFRDPHTVVIARRTRQDKEQISEMLSQMALAESRGQSTQFFTYDTPGSRAKTWVNESPQQTGLEPPAPSQHERKIIYTGDWNE
jgi:hypothetical protein